MDRSSTADQDFPVGATLADGSITVTEWIRGDAVRGMCRGRERDGRRLLLTVTSRQNQPLDQRARELDFHAEGLARLRHLGSLDDEHDVMAEEEPAGRPTTELALPLAPGAAVELAAEVAAVLERVHATGLVLGFLRPELIYVDDGADALRLTGVAPRADMFVLTASAAYGAMPLFDHLYAAPEVLAMKGGLGPAADVFSLAASLAVWVTGEHPFLGDTPTAQMSSIWSGKARVWTGPSALGMVLSRALERDAGARPPLATLIRDLRASAGQP